MTQRDRNRGSMRDGRRKQQFFRSGEGFYYLVNNPLVYGEPILDKGSPTTRLEKSSSKGLRRGIKGKQSKKGQKDSYHKKWKKEHFGHSKHSSHKGQQQPDSPGGVGDTSSAEVGEAKTLGEYFGWQEIAIAALCVLGVILFIVLVVFVLRKRRASQQKKADEVIKKSSIGLAPHPSASISTPTREPRLPSAESPAIDPWLSSAKASKTHSLDNQV